MKKLFLLLLAILTVVCLAACGEEETVQPVEETNVEVATEENVETDVPKSEQIGTAGSNIPLKDNYEEIERGVREAIFDMVEAQFGDKAYDVRVILNKAYMAEDEQEVPAIAEKNLGADEVAVEFEYEIKPSVNADSGDIMLMTVPNGEYDEESGWISEKYGLGVLKMGPEGRYIIDYFGTGW